ncbi:MAG: gamma carbonic anhydrase family protein [Gammaproteobacteria bacterium]|nr:gamma carbonic anhydrase family protein [Gammaproteobacteria bacterium]
MNIRSFQGKSPRIAASAYIDPAALVIGDVSIGEDSSLWPMVVARGDVESIHIGARTNIQDGSVLHVTHDSEFSPGGASLRIGSDVTVGHRVILHACTVGDHCLIGMGATVLDGAVIGERTMIGAGSLVPAGKHLDGGFLYLGSPARRIRPLNEEEQRYLEYAARHYVNLAGNYRTGARKG